MSSNTSKKHALLIACPINLKGTVNDVTAMTKILEQYGFQCDILSKATRAQILERWDNLVEKTAKDDAVVVYYTGHGGRVKLTGDKPKLLKYLMPNDFYEPEDGDGWRGITDAELSGRIRQLTNITKNVTLILDCCFAACMARLPGEVKGFNHELYPEIRERVLKLFADNKLPQPEYPERNPHYVSVVGSREHMSSFEETIDKVPRGVLTEALEHVMLRERSPGRVSWRTIMLRVRDRMHITRPDQYPQIEGDDLRFAFSLERVGHNGALFASLKDNGVSIHGGSLHGVRVADTYNIPLTGDESRDVSATDHAVVEVILVAPTYSFAKFENQQHYEVLSTTQPSGFIAFLKKRSLQRLGVVLQCPSVDTKIRSGIEASQFLCSANTDAESIASVREEDCYLQFWSHEAGNHYLLRQWERVEGKQDDYVAQCITALDSWARCWNFFSLAEPLGLEDDFARPIDVEFGLVINGDKRTLSGQNLTIHDGEHVYMEIRNTRLKPLYISLFDILSDSVEQLSILCPEGHPVEPGESYLYGEYDHYSQFKGGLVEWPKDTPESDKGTPEKFVVLVSESPIPSLRGLETNPGTARGDEDEVRFDTMMELMGAHQPDWAQRAERESLEPKCVKFRMFLLSFQVMGGQRPLAS